MASLDLPRVVRSQGVADLSRDALRDSYETVFAVCRGAGVSRSDAEDIAQDIWLWLLRSGLPAHVIRPAWLRVVARNFLKRYWRARCRRGRREAAAVATMPHFSDPTAELNDRMLANQIEGRLPADQAGLLRLLRRGSSFAAAALAQGIPPGSHYVVRRRLLAGVGAALEATPGLRTAAPSGRGRGRTAPRIATRGITPPAPPSV
jgi:DNA-directed RNA polymerase specialized sigma24 family protein